MDTFAHITIPLLVLLALKIDTRKAVIMLPLAVIPDLDLFFRGHRLLFHNLFAILFVPIILTLFIWKYKPEYGNYAWIGVFYLTAHLILDLSEGTALFYPITTDFYQITANLYVNFWGSIPYPSFDTSINVIAAESTVAIGEHLGPSEAVQRYPSMSNTSSGLLLTILLAGLMYFEKSRVIMQEILGLVKDIAAAFKTTLFQLFK
ncbi:MAG: metal-dependent hydrolase [Thermoplasmata archaeon]